MSMRVREGFTSADANARTMVAMQSVFISSVQHNFEAIRAAVRRAVEILHMRPLMAELVGARRCVCDLTRTKEPFRLPYRKGCNLGCGELATSFPVMTPRIRLPRANQQARNLCEGSDPRPAPD
jgi:hypothetical protein